MEHHVAPFDLDPIGGTRGLHALINRVVTAGDHARHLYEKGIANRVAIKADLSPVTEADEAVETMLREFLETHYPKAAFLGEETGEHGNTNYTTRFIVDPIDGTRAFIRGLPSWSVLVGIEVDKQPIGGIAYMPAHRDLFVAVRGHGAQYNGRPLQVSTVDTLERALVMHGGLEQFAEPAQREALFRVSDAVWTMRGFGDFEGYRRVLLGHADAVIDPGVFPWDVCAGKVLLEEAGGRFTSLTGEDTIFGGSALGSNGRLHGRLLRLINRPGTKEDNDSIIVPDTKRATPK